MKLRRAMAISAATTLVAGAALASAPAALAAPAAAPALVQAAAPKVGGAVSLKDFPATVAAGGAQVTFTEVVSNTGDDAVALPVVFLTSAGHLATDQVKAQFKNPYTGKWVDAQLENDGPDGPGVAIILGSLSDTAEPDENSVVFIPAGKSVSIEVRLTLTSAAVAGTATAQSYAVLFPADPEQSDEPNGDGFLTGAKKSFTITAPGGSSAAPSASASPKPSASASAKPSPSSAKPSGSAKPTTPAKPTTGTKPGGVPTALPTKKPSTTTVAEAKKQAQTSLASTGGGDNSTAIAATGAGILAAGTATLVLLRRRKTNTHRA
jgi:LPXTG-motif cell wall-anchored protein